MAAEPAARGVRLPAGEGEAAPLVLLELLVQRAVPEEQEEPQARPVAAGEQAGLQELRLERAVPVAAEVRH